MRPQNHDTSDAAGLNCETAGQRLDHFKLRGIEPGWAITEVTDAGFVGNLLTCVPKGYPSGTVEERVLECRTAASHWESGVRVTR
jgi:hypothetical protein